MAKYRVALIGCGARAPAHIRAYERIPEAHVVACCAPGERRRTELAGRFGLRAYAEPAEMICQENPDMVHIITPPWTRVELLTLVSDLGVPLCTTEKPLASGVRDWRQLQTLCATSKTRFGVCHQLRWHENLMRCQQAIASGQLGAVQFLDISACMNIAGQGTHTLDYGMSLVGDSPVVRVFGNACGWSSSDPMHPGADTTEAYISFANGARGLWTSGPVSPRCGKPDVIWEHVRIAAYAQRGQVLFEEFGRWEIVAEGRTEGGDFGGYQTWAQRNEAAQTSFHQAMFAWHEGGPAVGTNLAHSLHEWAVVLALYQSALERRPIDMATFDPPDDLVDKLRAAIQGQDPKGSLS